MGLARSSANLSYGTQEGSDYDDKIKDCILRLSRSADSLECHFLQRGLCSSSFPCRRKEISGIRFQTWVVDPTWD